MNWASVWTDILLGLVIAGALGAWVPKSFWRACSSCSTRR